MIEVLLLLSLWMLGNGYLLHVIRMRIKDGLQQIRCRLAGKNDSQTLEIRDIVDRIEMVLEF